MEKQYGAEKTDAIIEDAWRRYAEIVNENADEPKKMYMHTRKRIYPAIAAFDAMTGNGISREEAAAFLNRYYEKRAAGVGSKIRGAMKIPGLYKLVPRFFAKMTKSSFGEDCGFRAILMMVSVSTLLLKSDIQGVNHEKAHETESYCKAACHCR